MNRNPYEHRPAAVAWYRTFGALLLLPWACSAPLPVAYFEELPLASGAWIKLAAEPTWVTAPPAVPGHVVLVCSVQSNLLGIAAPKLEAAAGLEIADRIQQALRTQIPAPEATAAAAAAVAAKQLVRRACRDEALTREMVPGNTLATVSGLYELPIEAILAAVAEAHRDLARKVLAGL